MEALLRQHGARRGALEALTRKEIQQLAMDANLKANQKTASLIDQLLCAGVAFAPQLSPSEGACPTSHN